jgi:hypothetical protein
VFGGKLRATVRGGRFSNNTSTIGVTVLAGSTLTVTDSNFTFNTLEKGAIYASYESTVSLDNVHITDNNATGYGAALYAVTSTATITNSTLSRNSAQGGGGAVHVKDRATLTMVNCHLMENAGGLDKEGCGGAVFATDSQVSITACNFTRNKADKCGGAVYFARKPPTASSASLTSLGSQNADVVRSTLFEGNMASAGGAFAVYSSSLLLDNSTFKGNSAQSMSQVPATSFGDYYRLGVGGAMYADNANVTFTNNCTLQDNRAVMDGGM